MISKIKACRVFKKKAREKFQQARDKFQQQAREKFQQARDKFQQVREKKVAFPSVVGYKLLRRWKK